MKNILLLVTIFFVSIFGMQANGFEYKVGENIFSQEIVDDDFYVAGGSVNINTTINGDLIIAGGDVNINSEIREDLIITGGNIDIAGSIGDDVKIAGGKVKINSDIEGDLIIGAGDVQVGKGVIIKGDLVVGAGRLILDGEVMGKAKIGVGQLVLNGIINGETYIVLEQFVNPSNSGAIKGNLKYKSADKIQALEDITEKEVIFEQSLIKTKVEKDFIGFISTFLLIKVISLFIFAILLYFYFNKLFLEVSNNLRKKTGKSFLHGFLIIVGTPFIVFLLFISVIGIPFALFFAFAYIFIFVFLNLLNVLVFASLFIDKYKIANIYAKLSIILGLSLVFGLINGIGFIAGFFTIGAMSIKELSILKSLRK